MVGLLELLLESIPFSDMHHRLDSSPQLLRQHFSLPGSETPTYILSIAVHSTLVFSS